MLPFTIARMKTNQFMQAVPIQVPDNHQFAIPIHQVKPPPNEGLPINQALQIKAAEY
jgi:hypothetical protein